MTIKMSEIIKENTYHAIPIEHRFNLVHLHYKLSVLRCYYNKPMLINDWTSRKYSGYRSKEDQFQLYRELNLQRAAEDKPKLSVPMGSQHLCGGAADVADRDGELKRWILDNLFYIEELGLWMEDFDATPTWVHLQIFPPASGNRFFKP